MSQACGSLEMPRQNSPANAYINNTTTWATQRFIQGWERLRETTQTRHRERSKTPALILHNTNNNPRARSSPEGLQAAAPHQVARVLNAPTRTLETIKADKAHFLNPKLPHNMGKETLASVLKFSECPVPSCRRTDSSMLSL